MRIIIALFVSLSLISCVEEKISTPEKSAINDDLSGSTSETATVTGLTQFKAANLSIPSGGLKDGSRFYSDLSLRANIAYYPYAVMKEVKNGIPRVRFYVKPTQPAQYLVGTPYPYHYRAEFTRNPWPIRLPLGTEEWLGFSYIFPTAAEGFTQNQTPVNIYQNHPERIVGWEENPPAFFIEIASPGQLRNAKDPYYYTPLGGEIMIVNKVRGIRWVVPGVRVVAGARLDFVIQIVYGLENAGLFNVWINGKLMTFPGNSTVPAGNVGSTVWPYVPVGGNSKIGLYHHQLKFAEAVTLNASKGHTHMRFWMTDWNDVFRKPTDWDYKNINAYSAVDTSTYP
jgi:hypothetical protein